MKAKDLVQARSINVVNGLTGKVSGLQISTVNKSISVLKGSSATAVYDSDASNGVLVITTRKGMIGKPVISYSSTVQVETVSYMPALQNQFGSNGGETIFYGYNNMSRYIPYENQQFGPQ